MEFHTRNNIFIGVKNLHGSKAGEEALERPAQGYNAVCLGSPLALAHMIDQPLKRNSPEWERIAICIREAI